MRFHNGKDLINKLKEMNRDMLLYIVYDGQEKGYGMTQNEWRDFSSRCTNGRPYTFRDGMQIDTTNIDSLVTFTIDELEKRVKNFQITKG